MVKYQFLVLGGLVITIGLLEMGPINQLKLFWNKLRRMAKKVAIQIPRCNDATRRKEIYAFPNAYGEIKNDRPCSLN